MIWIPEEEVDPPPAPPPQDRPTNQTAPPPLKRPASLSGVRLKQETETKHSGTRGQRRRGGGHAGTMTGGGIRARGGSVIRPAHTTEPPFVGPPTTQGCSPPDGQRDGCEVETLRPRP